MACATPSTRASADGVRMPPVAPPTFAALLRAWRLREGLTQEELAERAGLAAGAISALERGSRRRPYGYTIRALASALGLSDTDSQRLAAAARRHAASGDEPEQPGARSREPTWTGQSNLPALRTTLLGRAEEVAQIRALLTTEADRLVTITGTGGIGKTAVALRAAADMQEAFRDGVLLVELASISDGALVASTVTAALGVREAPGSSALQALVQFLHQRRVLLVLDNCEHVVDVCAELVEQLIA